MTLSACTRLRPFAWGPSSQQRERTTLAGIDHGRGIVAQDDDDDDDDDEDDEDDDDDEADDDDDDDDVDADADDGEDDDDEDDRPGWSD
jgi:hypothetical protein